MSNRRVGESGATSTLVLNEGALSRSSLTLLLKVLPVDFKRPGRLTFGEERVKFFRYWFWGVLYSTEDSPT